MNSSKGSGRYKRTSSQSEQTMSHQDRCKSDGEFYLPSGRGIYVTTTKNGRPAFGRKKKDRLLEDYGFDILGQAFGIPSRIDFEREAEREVRRRKAFTPQSSTPPLTPHQSSTKHHNVSQCESHPIAVSRKGLRSASTSNPVRIRCGTGSLSNCASYGKMPEAEDAILTPNYFYLPATPSPMPSPIWDFGNMAMSPNHGIPMTSTGNPQAFAVQLPTASSFSQSQPIMVPSPHYIQSPIHSVSQSVSTSPFFHHSQDNSPRQEFISPVYPIAGSMLTHAPPPPSPLVAMPLSTNQQRNESNAAALDSSLPLRYSPSEAKMCEEHYNAATKTTTQEAGKQGDGGKKKMKEAKRDIGKHIQHVHFCAGCGRVRSKKYQKEHPLERGQIPDRDYCTRCQREAALVESDDADDTVVNVNHHGTLVDIVDANHHLQNATEYHHTPTVTTNVSCTKCSKERHGKKACESCKQKKSRQFNSFSSVLTDSTVKEGHTIPPPSVSSTGGSDVGVSISNRGPKTGQHKSRRSKPPVGEAFQKVESNTPPLRSDASRENMEAILDNDTCIENSDLAASKEREELKDIASTLGLNDAGGNTYANDTCVSSKAPSLENPSRFSQQPSPGLLLKVRPKVSLQSVSDQPEVASLYHDSHDEMNTPMYKDPRHHTVGREAQVPQATYSDGHYHDSRNKQPISGLCRSIHEHNRPRASMQNSRVYDSQAHAYVTPGCEQFAAEPDISHQERSHRRRVRRHQDDCRAHCDKLGEQHMNNAMGPETPYDTDDVSGWDLPLTPTDLSHAYQTTSPCFLGEAWDANKQGEEEPGQEFELMAEEDLMSAAKFFDDMTSPIGNSGTSSFPMPNFMTHTEISIESYYSHRGVDDSTLPPAAYELYESSDLDSAADEESQTKTFGISSKVGQDKKTTRRIGNGASSTHYHWQKSRERQPESSPKLCENTYYSDERAKSSSPDLSPLDSASSIIAHTGHSLEGLQPDFSDHTNLAVVSKRRRIRQLLGL